MTVRRQPATKFRNFCLVLYKDLAVLAFLMLLLIGRFLLALSYCQFLLHLLQSVPDCLSVLISESEVRISRWIRWEDPWVLLMCSFFFSMFHRKPK